MNRLSLPDLGGAAPSACARDLARSTGPVHAVDQSLTTVCDLSRPAPTLLTTSPLAALGCPAPDDHRAVSSEPRNDRTMSQTADPDARAPLRRPRRPPADCPPEPPAARAVREAPTCRVGVAQLSALAGEPLPPAGGPSSRAVPSVGTGTRPATPAPPWPAALLTDRLGIDVRPSLACPPRPGPPAPPHLLVPSSLARPRVSDDPALSRVGTDQVRTPAADASPRFNSPKGRARGPEGPDARRHGGPARARRSTS